MTMLFLIAVLVIVLLAVSRTGYDALMEKDYLVHSAKSMATRLAMTLGLTWLALVAVVFVVGAIAASVRNAGGAIGIVCLAS